MIGASKSAMIRKASRSAGSATLILCNLGGRLSYLTSVTAFLRPTNEECLRAAQFFFVRSEI
jgi:hypothetical protein